MVGMFLLALLFALLLNVLIPFVWNLTELNIKNHMQLFRYNAYSLNSIRNFLFLIPQLLLPILHQLIIILFFNNLLQIHDFPAILILNSSNIPLMSLSGFMNYFLWPIVFLVLGLGIDIYLKNKYQLMKGENDFSLQNIIAKEDWLTIVMVMQIFFCNLFCYEILKTGLKIIFLNFKSDWPVYTSVYFSAYLILIILARCALMKNLIARLFFALLSAGLIFGICYMSWQ